MQLKTWVNMVNIFSQFLHIQFIWEPMEHYLLEPPCVLVLGFFLCIYQRLSLASKAPLHCKGLIPLICALQKHCPTGSLGCLHYAQNANINIKRPQGRMDVL